MRTIIASLAAAGVLVAGAFFASSVVPAPADAQVADTETTSPRAEARQEILDEVLAGLVADGTITQAQADAVSTAITDKAAELRSERQAMRELIKSFLEDDVITSDELAQLGDDHPFNDPDGPFAEAAEDGEITKEELRELRRERRGNRGGPGPAEEASTANNA